MRQQRDRDALSAALADGTIDALVAQDPFRIGYEAVHTLVDKLNGKTPPKRIDLSARVITKPEGAQVHVPAGFHVEEYLTDFKVPRFMWSMIRPGVPTTTCAPRFKPFICGV